MNNTSNMANQYVVDGLEIDGGVVTFYNTGRLWWSTRVSSISHINMVRNVDSDKHPTTWDKMQVFTKGSTTPLIVSYERATIIAIANKIINAMKYDRGDAPDWAEA